MADGSKKLASRVIKGDQVKTQNGSAKVLCVVKTLTNGSRKICEFENGLAITPGHPIMHNGEWRYPRDVIEPIIQSCDAVYNMVLDKDHIIWVNDVPLILLGHNYTHSILKHPYLGSQQVVRDL